MSDKEFLKYEDEQVEVNVDGVTYIKDTTYRVFADGTRKIACSVKYPKPSDETIEPQPTQLDRIESAVNDIAKNNTSYTEMASAIAEGVNDIE